MWSGPLAATMLSVPPETGFWLLVDDAFGVAEPPLLDVLEHAARPQGRDGQDGQRGDAL